MPEQFQTDETIPNGEEIVERFGGIRPMATKLNVPVTTVQGWKKRDAIPAARRDEIISAAALHNISLKGLVSEPVANQNTHQNARPQQATHAAASAAAPLAAATTEPHAPAGHKPATPRAETVTGIDLREVRRAARTSSLITSVSLGVIMLSAGLVLFGQSSEPGKIRSLENRVAAVETRESAFDGASYAELKGKVESLTAVVGATAQDVSAIAQNIANGQGQSLVQRMAALEQQAGGTGAAPLASMIERMQGLAQTSQGQTELSSAVAELRTIVSGLQGRSDGFEQAISEAKAGNDALARTLADVSGRDVGAAAMLLVMNQLRDTTGRGAPFADDLALLREIAQNTDPELVASIDKLAPYAQDGVLSPQALKRELLASANDIITAKMNGKKVSFKDKIMARLQGLFSIKKEGVPVTPNNDHTVIKQAVDQLDRGNVAAAVETLATVDGAATQAWQQKATGTLLAQQLDTQLVKSLILKLKNGLSGTPQPINLAPQTQVTVPQASEPQSIEPQSIEPQSIEPLAAQPQADVPQTQDGPVLEMPAPDNGIIISQ